VIKKGWYTVLLAMLFNTACTPVFSQSTRHVILISIDGFHPDMYLDSGWPCPNLRYLIRRGTYADHLISTFPSYTYPSHTAMVTGAQPARSGIGFNQPIGSQGEWSWYAKAIKVPTLWDVLKKNGLSTAAIEWPATVGAPITWNLPEIWRPGSVDRIGEARKYATTGLIAEIEQNATGRLDSLNCDDDRLALDQTLGLAAAYVFGFKRPAFMAVHFANVDSFEHREGRDGDSVRIALAGDDRAIGDILEAIKNSGEADSTAVIIVGDHGFATIDTIMRPNRLIREVPARFIASGGSAFLYSRSADKNGIIKAVTDSLNALPRGKRKLFRIIDRKELDGMGADSAALLALSAEPGMVFSASMGPAQAVSNGPGTFIQQNQLEGLFISTHGGHHGYDPNLPEMYTGFIAEGAGIARGGHIHSLREVDIAPLVAALLGIDFKTPDGQKISGILSF